MPLRSFKPLGDLTEAQSSWWHDFGRALDDYAVTPAAGDHVIAAARAAFTSQRDWFATDPAQFARQAWDAEASGTRFLRD